jgi:extracellular factor (EF) 3-hydroxypalmitic acid methyl ester biosynthesis protein
MAANLFLEQQDEVQNLPQEESVRRSSPKQYREERAELPRDTASRVLFQVEEGGQGIARLVNISRFGARVELEGHDKILRIGQLVNITIELSGICIYSGESTIVNETFDEGTGIVHFGIVIGGTGVDPDQVAAILGNSDRPSELISGKETFKLLSMVRPDFKALVADLNTAYQDVRYKLSLEEQKIKTEARSENHLRRLEEQIITLAISIYTDDIHQILASFKTITDQLTADETIIHKRYFRANFQNIVQTTPFLNHAYTKPRGYAGDYGLMVMFYDYKDSGSTLFDKFMHRFSCNEPAAVANKNRVELLANMLTDIHLKGSDHKSFKVSTVACGPAKEIELFLGDTDLAKSRPIEVVCIDQDPAALDYAQTQIRGLLKTNRTHKPVFLQEDAVMGLIRQRPFTECLAESDVIISAGLFDYLSDRVAQKLITALYYSLKPGGTLLIGNVSDLNPDRFSMNYFMEWNLVLRNDQTLKALVDPAIRSVAGVQIDVISESLGLNLFLRVRKPE